MKIMFVTHNPEPYVYDKPDKYSWNHLPSLFTKKGAIVRGVGKYELHRFYRVYKQFKPDLIITEWVPASVIPMIFKKIKLVKCPIILNWGDYYAEMMTQHPKFIIAFMENYAAKHADYIVTSSRYNQEKAKKLGKEAFLIYPGYFPGNKKTNLNLKKLEITKGPIVLYMGDQVKFKRVDKIIEAAKNLECDLFLVGPINEELLPLAKNHKNIHFMGRVDESEVRDVLRQADILVNTSDQDCSYKFFEYISIGKPILALNNRPKYLLTHKENAYLTNDFKEGLKELISNKELRKKIEKNIKKFKVYNWNEVGDQYINFFRKIIQK